jgi:hypothetical protein
MRKLFIPLGLASLLLVAAFGMLRLARAQAPQGGQTVLSSETQADNTREITAPSDAVPDQPNIGFIDSPTAACVQPDTTRNECIINWYYMSVSADPNYMITMTVKLNDFGYVARYNGFFQTSMYVPYNMNPGGFKVACGALGSGGDPLWGKSYTYTIRARDSANLGGGNYGSIYCPAYIP